ncbi:MAG: class II aldolase/adducin family protein [Alphaproteobacteria bacterium]
MTTASEQTLRVAVIAQSCWMNTSGLNQGTAGNISARCNDTSSGKLRRMLITPTGVPYETLEPRMIAAMPIDGEYGTWEGPLKPSSEWRFHLDIMRARPDVGGIVHTHSTFATVLAIAQRTIPACHYMVAAFGGNDVRCADFATFGTSELSANVLKALEGRTACLIANHGMIATGETLEKAMWAAVELETLAKQYYYASMLGDAVILSDEQMAEAHQAFKEYGVQTDGEDNCTSC